MNEYMAIIESFLYISRYLMAKVMSLFNCHQFRNNQVHIYMADMT